MGRGGWRLGLVVVPERSNFADRRFRGVATPERVLQVTSIREKPALN